MSRDIRILLEAAPVVDAQKSGVGHYVLLLLRSLSVHKPSNVTLSAYFFNLLGRKKKTSHKFERVHYKEIRFVPGKIIPLLKKAGRQPFLELFVWKRYDLVVFTNYVSLPSLRKTPSILVVYDLAFVDHPEYVQEKNLKYLQRFCPRSIERADAIITISEFTKRRMLDTFPDLINKPVVVTPIPPRTESRTKTPRIQDRLTSLGIRKHQYLLYLGTIEPRKNISNLVRAYEQIPGGIRSRYSLVLAGGKGWKDTQIISDIEGALSRGCNIIRPGYLSDAERDSLYAYATAFVFPSHYEGFGMPILEAMQWGVPCAISDIEVFREVAGNAALYFDKDDPVRMSIKITEILTNEATRKRLLSRHSRVLSAYSWAENAAKVYATISSVVR